MRLRALGKSQYVDLVALSLKKLGALAIDVPEGCLDVGASTESFTDCYLHGDPRHRSGYRHAIDSPPQDPRVPCWRRPRSLPDPDNWRDSAGGDYVSFISRFGSPLFFTSAFRNLLRNVRTQAVY